MQDYLKPRESRKEPRVRALLAARIIYNNGNAALDCTIRNMCESGAKLAFSGGLTVPDEFDLLIPQKDVTRRARTVWRRGEEIGIEFVRRLRRTEIGEAALSSRIRELEAENERLRARIRELTEG